ncbi:phospholipid/cholesterol/gamma-HCH transport system substrate-binding protein [Nocardioides terrae]|uniref:Phospholipid/cholesterol/gamma-HCH transport system substrate-binding protein n=1 Tax=Nocardioides terrae TaxID=574651 RepID=A0A1I1KIE0_9ACTN|nr:MlaD family protein [Nocardioides terrae]SFC60421.1 phospholipid/cholesterol/gamma-HCH transport system substrate-binding protein [Nocardioides terrae]
MKLLLDKRTRADLLKLIAFVVVTTLATGLLVITIGNISFGGTKDYKAVFSDATGVNKGDDVRIAGVKVGTVRHVEITDRTRALVTFSVSDDEALSTTTHAAIRYRNLVGQRYIALSGESGDGGQLHQGQTIPVSQTSPALDLTVLFNGFKPLFQALSPSDINKLSYEIVQVFQGEGSTLDSLLAHTASVTQTLADRDAVIDSLIDNLNQVLDHLGDRDQQLSTLITTFRTFVHGLTGDRKAILDSLDQITGLSVQTADLLKGIRSPFVQDIKQLRKVAGNIDSNKAELDRVIQVLPIKLNKVGNTATYGSFFNFYLCNFTGTVKLPAGQELPVSYKTGGARCNLS